MRTSTFTLILNQSLGQECPDSDLQEECEYICSSEAAHCLYECGWVRFDEQLFWKNVTENLLGVQNHCKELMSHVKQIAIDYLQNVNMNVLVTQRAQTAVSTAITLFVSVTQDKKTRPTAIAQVDLKVSFTSVQMTVSMTYFVQVGFTLKGLAEYQKC